MEWEGDVGLVIHSRDGENVAGSGEREKQAAVRAQHDGEDGGGNCVDGRCWHRERRGERRERRRGRRGRRGRGWRSGREIGSGKAEKKALNKAGPLSGSAGYRFGLAGSVPIRELPRVLPFTDGANGSSCHRSCAAMANHAGLRWSCLKPHRVHTMSIPGRIRVAFSRPLRAGPAVPCVRWRTPQCPHAPLYHLDVSSLYRRM